MHNTLAEDEQRAKQIKTNYAPRNQAFFRGPEQTIKEALKGGGHFTLESKRLVATDLKGLVWNGLCTTIAVIQKFT